MSELDVQNTIRVEGAKVGLRLWRNNSGALTDVEGRLVRFGLGNDSPKTNKTFKSSDLIGVQEGTGRFVAIECKAKGWKYHGTNREVAQLNYINCIKRSGGLACFAASWDDVKRELGL
jgi:hypothetical protein